MTYQTPGARTTAYLRIVGPPRRQVRPPRFFRFGDFSLDVETVYFSADYAVYMNCQRAINLA